MNKIIVVPSNPPGWEITSAILKCFQTGCPATEEPGLNLPGAPHLLFGLPQGTVARLHDFDCCIAELHIGLSFITAI
jgi:hypothetical protein